MGYYSIDNGCVGSGRMCRMCRSLKPRILKPKHIIIHFFTLYLDYCFIDKYCCCQLTYDDFGISFI